MVKGNVDDDGDDDEDHDKDNDNGNDSNVDDDDDCVGLFFQTSAESQRLRSIWSKTYGLCDKTG